KSLIQLGMEYGGNLNPSNVAVVHDLTGDASPRRIDLGQRGQNGYTALVLSPDRRIVAVVVPDSIRLVRLADGKEIGRITKANELNPSICAFTPDGKSLVSTSGPGTKLTVWEVPSGKVLRQIDGPNPVIAFVASHAISPDGKTLAWSNGPAISLIDLETGKLRNDTPCHTGALREALFSADGREIMTRSTDGRLLRWDPATGKQIGKWDVP